MPLLDHYLRAVRFYLSKGPQQDDIIEEIAGHLTAIIEEEESHLGRPLTEVEEEALLTRHGGPMVVAARYGVAQRGLAFGRQLISPETFQRRSRRTGAYPSGWVWNFPPQHLQPIPPWQSAAGAVVLGLGAAWWAAVPYAPSLVIGGAARYLELTAAWEPFYWPVLLVLVALFLKAYPYVTVTPGTTVAHASQVAVGLSDGIWWHSGFTFGLYSLSCLVFNLILCVQFARRRLEQTA